MKNQNNIRIIILIGASTMAVAVILGAFGAHSLKAVLSEYQLAIFKTGIQYHFYHGLGILALANLHTFLNSKDLKRIALLFFIGVLLFSGSLYLLATRELIGLAYYKWLGPLTPLGGICFVCGWIYLFIKTVKKK